MSRIYLHIGASRTASTSLQMQLFARHPGLFYLGKAGPEAAYDFCKYVSFTNVDEYSEKKARTKLQEILPGDVELPVLFSLESFSSPEFGPIGVQARRVRELLGDATVIYVIRRQYTLATSHFFKKKLYQEFASIGEWVLENAALVSDGRHASFGKMDFWNVAKEYSTVFGAENLKIFQYEDLVEDQGRFVEGICGLLGVDKKTGIDLMAGRPFENVTFGSRFVSESTLLFRKGSPFVNRIRTLIPQRLQYGMQFIARYSERRKGSDVGLSADARRALEGLYVESNRQLVRDFGVCLDERIYPI